VRFLRAVPGLRNRVALTTVCAAGLRIGEVARLKGGEPEVRREDIKRFAGEFDPQPFHLDEAAAERTVFKGVVA
jgi:acyl dehydratase